MRRAAAAAAALALAVALGWSAPRGGDDAEPAGRGKAVFERLKCWMCHSIAGEGNKKHPLDGVGSRLTPEQIRTWIVSPRKMKDDSKMKAYRDVPPEDLDALVAHLSRLKNGER